MKVVIAGSRTINQLPYLEKAMGIFPHHPTIIISGGAKGVDELAQSYAIKSKIPFKEFKAEWDRYGLGAGLIRNEIMAEHGEALVALWDGRSTGTKHMIKAAKNRGLIVYVFGPVGELVCTYNNN